ncbi:hypothetical protein [Variovorax soli]|uniref:hypothetical protein n=1 Tax=Variovorax soli TaxID=376815 RepID=UPI000837B713|nr:hypothetical protein [Variovorax soli]
MTHPDSLDAEAPGVSALVRRPRGRPAKTHDNRAVRAWLLTYWDCSDFRVANRRGDDVLVGVASARSEKDTGRGLSVRRLFNVLRSLDELSASGVADRLQCAKSTAAAYSLAARVASRFLEPLALHGPKGELVLGGGFDYAVPDDFGADHRPQFI